jgi:hypothetical protein
MSMWMTIKSCWLHGRSWTFAPKTRHGGTKTFSRIPIAYND